MDNKTNEFAEWDFELLETELDGMDFDGFDFGFEVGREISGETKFKVEGTGMEERAANRCECPNCGFVFEL